MSKVIEVTNDTFENEVIQSTIPVLVDFWAPWCGPCKAMMPALEQLSERNVDKIKVVKINIDSEEALSTRFKIRAVPTQMLFRNGIQIGDSKVGASNLSSLENWINIQS